jgi:hypothetical protein
MNNVVLIIFVESIVAKAYFSGMRDRADHCARILSLKTSDLDR